MEDKFEDFFRQVKETFADFDPDELAALLKLLYWALKVFRWSKGKLGESEEPEPVDIGPISVSAGAPTASVSVQVIDAD